MLTRKKYSTTRYIDAVIFNELYQNQFCNNPRWNIVQKGSINEHKFVAKVSLLSNKYTYVGKGTSKQNAKLDAAKHALENKERWVKEK